MRNRRLGFIDAWLLLASFVPLLVALGTVWRALYYIFQPEPPFGFYSDLGASAITIDGLSRSIHSFADARDVFSWFVWGSFPAFQFAPMLSYAGGALLHCFVADPFTVVKVEQVAEFAAAVGGMAWLHALLARRGSVWSWAAGLVYASTPYVALTIRGSVDIGWAVALVPALAALGVRLARSENTATLPLWGLACGVVGFGFHVEYGVLIGVPVYIAAASVVALRRRTLSAWLWFAAGLAVLVAFPAYYVLPTLAGQGLFKTAIARGPAVQIAGNLGLFSESFHAFAGFLTQENLISPRAQFNAAPDYWLAAIGSAPVLFGVAMALAFRRGRSVEHRLVLTLCVVSLICFFISLGSTNPIGAAIWQAFSQIPLLNSLRTPDRFAGLAVLASVLVAALAAERLAYGRRVMQAIGLTAAAVTLSAYYAFDLRQNVLVAQVPQWNQPDLRAVNARVRAIGPKTVSFAFVRSGSVFDYPSYGSGTATIMDAYDIAGKYLATSSGVGLLERLGVRSIVTSPAWISEGPALPPDFATEISRSPDVALDTRTPGGVQILRSKFPSDAIRPVSPACFVGSLRLLDVASALPALRGTAFTMPGTQSCEQVVNADVDTLDDRLIGAATQAWTAAELLPSAQAVRGTDYGFEISRFYIADPAYGNTVGGRPSLISPVGVSVPADGDMRLPPSALLDRGGLLAIRLGTDHPANVILTAKSAREVVSWTAPAIPDGSYHWYVFPQRAQSAGTFTFRVAGDRLAAERPILDGVVFAPRLGPARPARGRAVLATMRADAETARSEPERSCGLQRQNDSHYLVTAGGECQVNARFALPPASQAAVTVSVMRRGQVASHWLSIPDRGSTNVTFSQAADVLQGDRLSFDVRGLGDDVAATSDVELRVRQPLLETIERDTLTSIASFDAAKLPADSSLPDDATLYDGALHGSRLRFDLDAKTNAPADIDAQLVTSKPASGSLTIACKSGSARFALGAVTTEGEVHLPAVDHCAALVGLAQGDAGVARLRLIVRARAQAVAAAVELPAGRFAIRVIDSAGRNSRPASVSVDHRSYRSGTVAGFSAGRHLVETSTSSEGDRIVVFAAPDPGESAAGFSSRQRSAATWSVHASKPTVLELTQPNDGHWFARSGAGGGPSTQGFTCDLENTCFRVGAGDHTVSRVVPREIALGFALTLCAGVFAAGSLALSRRGRRWLRRTKVRAAAGPV